MSLAEEPSQGNDQKETEIQQDDFTSKSDREDPEDKYVTVKDFALKTDQRERRTIGPLTLFREDFSQLKEEVLRAFKDKDTKSQAENKPSISALQLLREDLNQLREDVSSIFSISSSRDKDLRPADPKTSQSAERTVAPLRSLTEDLSNVFKISLSKQKDNKGLAAKEDAAKIKVLKAESTDDPFGNLLRKDDKLFKASEKAQDGLRRKPSEQKRETVEAEKANETTKDEPSESEDSDVDNDVSEETSESVSETQGHEDQAADQGCGRVGSSVVSKADEKINEEEEEAQPSETPSSGISLLSLRDTSKQDTRNQLGEDVWAVKNFACYLTFDPNTANSELCLTDCNRRVTRAWSEQRSLHHPERFERCPQVLCREGLLDSVYWEVDWRGGADVGITYNSISRGGDAASCLLGHNERSWSLECSEGSYTPCYNNKRFRSSSPEPFTHRVGVYLNWSAGSLSFYCVSQDAMVHLHTFTSTFTEPLYPGFWVWAYDGSVTLCQVELDWERLLQ